MNTLASLLNLMLQCSDLLKTAQFLINYFIIRNNFFFLISLAFHVKANQGLFSFFFLNSICVLTGSDQMQIDGIRSNGSFPE